MSSQSSIIAKSTMSVSSWVNLNARRINLFNLSIIKRKFVNYSGLKYIMEFDDIMNDDVAMQRISLR